LHNSYFLVVAFWCPSRHPANSVKALKGTITACHTLILHFNSHFPGRPGLAGTRMSAFWILMELKWWMWWWQLEICWRCAKLQSNCHHKQTNTNQQFLQAGCPSCCPNNSKWCTHRNLTVPWFQTNNREDR